MFFATAIPAPEAPERKMWHSACFATASIPKAPIYRENRSVTYSFSTFIPPVTTIVSSSSESPLESRPAP